MGASRLSMRAVVSVDAAVLAGVSVVVETLMRETVLVIGALAGDEEAAAAWAAWMLSE